MEGKEVLDELRDRKEYYGPLHEEQRIDDEFYELKFDAGIPRAKDNKELLFGQRTPATAREWVDIPVRDFTLDNPTATMMARGKGDGPREKDALVEAFLNYWLSRMILAVKMAAKKLPLRGESILKIAMDDSYFGIPTSKMKKEEAEAFREKKLHHFPLQMFVPDPINVYCSPAHDGLIPADVIESYEITVAEALRLCERNGWDKGWHTGQGSTKKVKWTSYISATERHFFIEETPLLPKKAQQNILGFCPYVHIPSGFGNSDFDGGPEKLYRSILYPRRGMLKLQARALSQADAYNARYAWRLFQILGEEADVKRFYPDGLPTLNPNEVLRGVKGLVEPGFLPLDAMPSGLMEMMAAMQTMAEPPLVSSGHRPPGVYSGQGIAELKGPATRIYKDCIKNLEEGLAIFLGMGLRIIDKVYRDDVAFKDLSEGGGRQKEMGPKDIDGHYDCEVHLLAEPPEATEMRRILGANLQSGGVISHKGDLMRYHDMTEEEAEDEIAQLNAEAVMKEPGMREGVLLDALERLGMYQQMERLRGLTQGNKIEEIPPNQRTSVGPSREGTRIQGRQVGPESGPTPSEVEGGGFPGV